MGMQAPWQQALKSNQPAPSQPQQPAGPSVIVGDAAPPASPYAQPQGVNPYGSTAPQQSHGGAPQPVRDTPSQPNQVAGYQGGAPQPVRDTPSQPNYAAGAFQVGVPQGAPQQVAHQPSQPNYPAGYPAPGAPHGMVPGASATQQTRGDDGLDTPPKNMMPIYAAIAGAVIVAIIIIVLLAT
jgi:hypothetical protein